MKVHRIITTIEVENDNSITSVELTNLHPTNADIPLAITNLTSTGNANDIEQLYRAIDNHRLGIASKLKSITRIVDNSLDGHDSDEITDDNTITEIDDDLLL
jgi:hypothetical protein